MPILAKKPSISLLDCSLFIMPFLVRFSMLYKNINLKKLVCESNSMPQKTNYVSLVRFLNLSLFAKTLKSVLVGTLKSTVKKLSVSKAVIFSISVGA